MNIQQWQERLSTWVSCCLDPAAFLVAPPPESKSPEKDLAALLAVRQKLEVNDLDISPHREAAVRMAPRAAAELRKDDVIVRMRAMLAAVDNAIARCIDKLPPEKRVGEIVRTGDFGDIRFATPAFLQDPTTPTPLVLAVGIVKSLSKSHWLAAFAADDPYLYDVSGGVSGVVLGRCDANMNPRPFYSLPSVKSWNATLRTRQKRDIADQVAREKQEETRRREQFWQSPLGVLERQRQELERLRDKGQIPEFTLPAPAVRVGR